MPRRTLLTTVQQETLLAFPVSDVEIARYYTFDEHDLAIIRRRRGVHNRFGFAVQLCYLRYPGYPQGHLHHECDRIAEQRDPCSHKETQGVPDGRLSTEGCLSGDQGCVKKMAYADPELATGDESFYYRVR